LAPIGLDQAGHRGRPGLLRPSSGNRRSRDFPHPGGAEVGCAAARGRYL